MSSILDLRERQLRNRRIFLIVLGTAIVMFLLIELLATFGVIG